MAIPKEPRQLMINIMYLVLTALLALNVSAEIFNAFKVVDKGLVKSNKVLDETNSKIPEQIAKLAKKKDELAVYAERAIPVREISEEFSTFIDSVIDSLIEGSGGYAENGGIVGYKNKDVTTRNLVHGGQGNEIKERMFAIKDKMMEFIDEDDRDAFASQLAVDLDTLSWMDDNKSRKRNWAAFTFDHMPVQAVLPILNKYKNDVKSTESAVLNYLQGKVGGEDIVLDQFQVVAVPKKGYVIKGETYEADIFLSASAGTSSNTAVDIKVNGSNLQTENGVAKFVQPTNSTGIKDYTATITVTNPTTGEVKSYESLFSYEVGERSVSVSADKMNVMYVGVDNPLSITAAGISSNDMEVSGSGSGLQISKTGNGKYNARVTSQGKAIVTVSGGGLAPSSYEYRTKFIPTPVPELSGNRGGKIANGVFRAQKGLIPKLDNFDFDAKCEIKGFKMVRIEANGSFAGSEINPGTAFNAATSALTAKAKPGDYYLFENIQCQCPGWPSPKKLPDMTFQIQ